MRICKDCFLDEELRSEINASKHSIFRLDAHYSQTYLCAITK